MKILLTGAYGMVGQNILNNPLIKNFKIIYPSKKKLNLESFNDTLKFFKKTNPDLIIHAAGKVGGIQANLDQPVDFLLKNIDIGRNVIWAAKKSNIKRVLNLASSCIYPKNYNTPIKEDYLLKGELESSNEGYALAKIVTLKLCQFINEKYKKLKYKTIIPCNLFGLYDKFHPTKSHLIPAIIVKLHQAKQKKKKNVEIWGNGLARREFMFASDFSDLIIKCIINFDKIPNMLNLGLGYDYTIKDYYKIVARVIGYKGKFTYNIKKPSGMKRKLLCIKKQKSMDWSVKTDIYQNIKKTYDYYLKKKNEV